METACLLFGAMAWYVMIPGSVPLGLKYHAETGSGSGTGFPEEPLLRKIGQRFIGLRPSNTSLNGFRT